MSDRMDPMRLSLLNREDDVETLDSLRRRKKGRSTRR